MVSKVESTSSSQPQTVEVLKLKATSKLSFIVEWMPRLQLSHSKLLNLFSQLSQSDHPSLPRPRSQQDQPSKPIQLNRPNLTVSHSA
jgi:hypothetical protein